VLSARLSPLDASFLAVETPSAHMHVGWAAVFDPPEGRDRPSFEELREHVSRRLPRAPRYRQAIREVPFGINAPVWVDDDGFDIRNHVVQATSGRLDEVAGECMSQRLPRDRPLWQLWVAPRLDDGRVGIVGKAHHCMVDGIAAVELASLLLDPEADPPEPDGDDWSPAPGPSRRRLLAEGAIDLARRPLDLATLPARAMRSPGRAIGALRSARRAAYAIADAARPARPVDPLNNPISPHRRLGLLGRPLEELLRIKNEFGVKLNDVLLAVCAGGVRSFLMERESEPMCLKTMVPVNVRGENGAGEFGNRIAFMFVDLPCDEPDPIRRLRALHAATAERKQAGEPEGADTVIGSMTFTPSPVQRVVSRMIASPRTFNLVVSNIPGPREPMYMRGCRLAEAYPVVPIAERHALAIGVTTIGDGAFFGLYADRETLPDVNELAGCIDDSIDELLALCEYVPAPADLAAPVGAG
jgi:diacylglycerol O-acyltransferase / wax synthase